VSCCSSRRRWLALVARRAGTLVAVSAPLTILSGMYLFAALHPHDASAVVRSEDRRRRRAAFGSGGRAVSRPAGRTLLQ